VLSSDAIDNAVEVADRCPILPTFCTILPICGMRLALVMVELSSGRRLLAVPGPDELLIAF
jgi:hypothetical protein